MIGLGSGTRVAALVALAAWSGQGGAPSPAPASPPPTPSAPRADTQELVAAMEKLGIRLSPERGLCTLTVRVDIRDDLLEYVLVNPRGQAHESLFVSEVSPRALNAALLALGVQAGKNVRITRRDPPPTPDELRDGVAPYTIAPPAGDGFYLYAAWRCEDETYVYRVEDLVRNLESGRSMTRHRWVFLGSKTAPDKKNPGQELFAAELEGNLINLALFEEGYTLLTSALPECIKQSIWLPNSWLLPERGEPVELVFSREKLVRLPDDVEARLPRAQCR
jgi:hypothetical protein